MLRHALPAFTLVLAVWVAALSVAESPITSFTPAAASAALPQARTVALFPIAQDATPSRAADPLKSTTTPTKPAPILEELEEMSPDPRQVVRIRNPYSFPELSLEAANATARAAIVNILCSVQTTDTPVSGSGVLIDPRGIVLTNAHVAQYVLLEDASPIPITCVVRSGSPATERYRADVLFIPDAWVREHAPDITVSRPTGTGENDVALLVLSPLKGAGTTTLPSLPFVEPEVREGVTFTGDSVLVAGYPAGFSGSFLTYNHLVLTSSLATVSDLFTFTRGTIDLFSVGGIILAQGGSSGGAVVNAWGKLVGIVTTSSDAATTKERDLRAVSIPHVDRVLRAARGESLSSFLKRDIPETLAAFRTTYAPQLAEMLASEVLR